MNIPEALYNEEVLGIYRPYDRVVCSKSVVDLFSRWLRPPNLLKNKKILSRPSQPKLDWTPILQDV